ncbi:uncharacterized protein LOC144715343 isoform X2 [Wolffia australiana]
MSRGISSSKASCSSASSRASCRKVLIDASSTLGRLNFHWHQKSTTVSIQSCSIGENKRPKKITKMQRRAMVQSFVEKYRADNAGKFPTASSVRQQVGGGHYFIREILQELDYNSRFHAPKKKEIKGDVSCSSFGTKENQITQSSGDRCDLQTHNTFISHSDKHARTDPEESTRNEADSLNKASIAAEKSLNKEACDGNLMAGGVGGGLFGPFNSLGDRLKLETKGHVDDLHKAEGNNADRPHQADVKLRADHADPLREESSSVWSNMTSMAWGILNFFKKKT